MNTGISYMNGTFICFYFFQCVYIQLYLSEKYQDFILFSCNLFILSYLSIVKNIFPSSHDIIKDAVWGRLFLIRRRERG